ncbi:MAG: membrane trafficking protein [Clostridiales bacterium]|jgi:nucleotidyltransferase/DNA polymerase involved in DNA repair|nr:membrane trafficking protein [Eubacteriales bacterium]MDH7566532.1 membrane trafficking protein [Clostridiales bacterium]
MNDAFTKKLSEVLGKMDEKVLQAQLASAMDMLKKGNTEELAKKLGKIDKEELTKKLNEFDESKLNELGISKEELRRNIKDVDFDKLAQLIGENGDQLIKKIKDMIK